MFVDVFVLALVVVVAFTGAFVVVPVFVFHVLIADQVIVLLSQDSSNRVPDLTIFSKSFTHEEVVHELTIFQVFIFPDNDVFESFSRIEDILFITLSAQDGLIPRYSKNIRATNTVMKIVFLNIYFLILCKCSTPLLYIYLQRMQ